MSEEENLDAVPEDVKAWGEGLSRDLARRLVRKGIFAGHARVEARWVIPGRILIGVAWQEDMPERKVWVIGGEAVSPDFIELSAASDPRDAARNFAMRWQLSGARIGTAAEGDGEQGQIDFKAIEARFQRQAEMLHDLVSQDHFWQNIQPEPGAKDNQD